MTESAKAFEASIAKATGEMVAVNQDTGKIEWDDKLPSSPYGAATVTNNVVFTTTYSGHLYAFNADHRRDPAEHTAVRRARTLPSPSTATTSSPEQPCRYRARH